MREIIMSEHEIHNACIRLGEQISNDLRNENKPPVILGVMKGALHFMCDLVKHINIPIFLDYVQISSYFGTENTGKIRLIKDIDYDLNDRTVVIVEDVIDSGNSINYLIELIKEKYNPKQILICALFNKINARESFIEVHYTGKILTENKFLVGYGLDYKELLRDIPYVYVATPEEIEELDKLFEK